MYIGGEYDVDTSIVKSGSQLIGGITGFALVKAAMTPSKISTITGDTGDTNRDKRANSLMYTTIGSDLVQTMTSWETRPGITKTNGTNKCTDHCASSASGKYLT